MSNKKSPEGLEKFKLIVSIVANILTIAWNAYRFISEIINR